MNANNHCVSAVIFAFGIFLLTGCADFPEDCLQNVKSVVSLDFSGPNTIELTPQYDFAGYDVTIVVEKEDQNKPARVCYIVRDDDPWTKFLWAIDDVLDASFVLIPAGQNSRTAEGNFVLYAKNDNNICGAGSLPGDLKISDCSGESQAEVYLQTEGRESTRHVITLQ